MFSRTVSADDLARLKAAREEADRAYNEALTALDRAIQSAPEIPYLPPPIDDSQVAPLNELRKVMPDGGPDLGTGWRSRLLSLVWHLIGPILRRQEDFNSAVVDYINRSLPPQHKTNEAVASAVTVLTQYVEGSVMFQSKLVQYLQQVTPYVDTKDYEFDGLTRRSSEDGRELIESLDKRTRGLTSAIDGVTDEMLKRWESMVARERRYEASVDEVRTGFSVVQRASQTLKRELDRLLVGEGSVGGVSTAGKTSPTRPTPPSHPADPAPPTSRLAANQLGGTTDAYKYVGFEDEFRGAVDEIRTRQAAYVQLFDGASDVLDVGCGRGEFLDLLKERGIQGRGIDINHEMVEICRGRGLEVSEGNALEHLRSLPDGALGGLIALQVVEHLEPSSLIRLLEAAYHKLRPGSKIVLETVNAACWAAFFESYIRDITHVRPLHPDTLKYLVTASGFQRATVRFSAPYPEASKLQPIAVRRLDKRALDAQMATLLQTFNDNADKINRLLFTYLDYAVVAERL